MIVFIAEKNWAESLREKRTPFKPFLCCYIFFHYIVTSVSRLSGNFIPHMGSAQAKIPYVEFI